MVKKKSGKKDTTFDGVDVKKSDMPMELLTQIVKLSKAAFENVDVPIGKDVATQIKQGLDQEHKGTTWHCIVGKHFAVSITHSTKYMCFFTLNGFSVLVFKSDY